MPAKPAAAAKNDPKAKGGKDAKVGYCLALIMIRINSHRRQRNLLFQLETAPRQLPPFPMARQSKWCTSTRHHTILFEIQRPFACQHSAIFPVDGHSSDQNLNHYVGPAEVAGHHLLQLLGKVQQRKVVNQAASQTPKRRERRHLPKRSSAAQIQFSVLVKSTYLQVSTTPFFMHE